jgi:hypothetical protein
MQASAADYALFYHPETAISHLTGRRPDHHQIKHRNACFAWLILVQLHMHLDLGDLDDFSLFLA